MRKLQRIMIGAILCLACSIGAMAQYGGGGGGGTSSSGSGSPGYSSGKKALVIGVVAGAAAVGGVLYWLAHRPVTITGCTSAAGVGGIEVSTIHQHTYVIETDKVAVLAGHRVMLKGKKVKTAGVTGFKVIQLVHDYGACK